LGLLAVVVSVICVVFKSGFESCGSVPPVGAGSFGLIRFFFGKGSGEFESGFFNRLSSFQASGRLAKVLIRQSPLFWQSHALVKSGF
jgi:hypothetical protein